MKSQSILYYNNIKTDYNFYYFRLNISKKYRHLQISRKHVRMSDINVSVQFCLYSEVCRCLAEENNNHISKLETLKEVKLQV